MDHGQSTTMAHALRLTRAGRLAEATALLQSALNGIEVRDDAPHTARAPFRLPERLKPEPVSGPRIDAHPESFSHP